jgi:biotin/methionine sulfoxide reductase
VHEPFWTASARHADIVFPCTTTLERNDLGVSSWDDYISPMRQVVKPFSQARSDYEIFSGLARRLGFEDKFTNGWTEMEWVRHLYEITRKNAAAKSVELPDFDTFWQGEQIHFGNQLRESEYILERFRRDPDQYPLGTPSGKIEIFSDTIASFEYADCQGHPRWYQRTEWLGSERAKTYPLHMISNQPRTRLHSQYDHGVTSRKAKIQGRERARMNSFESSKRGLTDGDIMRVFNDRGACLAGLEISENIRSGVIELPTGAWFDSREVGGEELEVHGNPNALTPDKGTSSLAQGCTAHSCLVEVIKFTGTPPDVKAFEQPDIQIPPAVLGMPITV